MDGTTNEPAKALNAVVESTYSAQYCREDTQDDGGVKGVLEAVGDDA